MKSIELTTEQDHKLIEMCNSLFPKHKWSKFKETIFNKESIINDFPKISTKMYPKEVLEIHHEFETAAEKLLEQANEIINSQPIVNESKISKLKAFGFTQVKEVVETTKMLIKTEMSKEQINLIKYYQQNYPFNKFIIENQVETICHKYNLVCGPVNRFKGFVPEKNLKDIENFKLKEKENFDNIVIWKNDTGQIENLDWNKVHDVSKVQWLMSVYLIDRPTCYIDDHASYPKYSKLINRKLITDEDFKTQESLQLGLQICAPIKDMDISGLELKEGYKLEKKHIPDPIVLQPVKGGYLILTAWGDEASDSLVVNENFN